MSTRPTVRQMTEAMKAASSTELNTLLFVVLGACRARGFLDRKATDAVIQHVCYQVYKEDPAAALRETERLNCELDELDIR